MNRFRAFRTRGNSIATYRDMKDESQERCLELCERASKEQDPKRMLALVSEINRLLEEKEARLHPKRESRLPVAATSGDSFFEFALPTVN